MSDIGHTFHSGFVETFFNVSMSLTDNAPSSTMAQMASARSTNSLTYGLFNRNVLNFML